MKVSRRSFLRFVIAAGASAGTGGLLARLLKGEPPIREGPDGISRVQGRPEAVPAYVASASSTGHLVHTAAVPATPSDIQPSRSPAPEDVKGKRWVMVIDLSRCNGCGECTVACNRFHFVPPGQEWIKVYANQDNDTAGPYWFPRPCMQCDNPPCVKVCPVGATYKREDGIVIQDLERCIGCRYCIPACPYSARYFNWSEPPHTPEELAVPYSIEWNYPHPKGVVEKCIFCPVLVREKRLPACVAACPMGALYFGDEEEDAVTNSLGETLRFSEMVRANGGYRYLEELGTEPRVYYLPPRNRTYPAPPKEAVAQGSRRRGGG